MPRNTTTLLNTLLLGCETRSIVEMRLRDNSSFFFCTGGPDMADFLTTETGNAFSPELLTVSDLTVTLGQATNRVGIEISNVNDPFGLSTPGDIRKLKMANVTIKKLFKKASSYEITHYFTGKTAFGNANEKTIPLDIISDTTAAGTCLATVAVSPTNGFKFPDTPEQSPPGSETNPGPIFHECFVVGTMVETPGGARPIEDFRPGDGILSFNETGELFEDEVLEVFENEVDEYLELEFENTKVQVTPNHRFLSDGWVRAEDMQISQIVDCLNGFDYLKAKELIKKRVTVRNLHVKNNHNYIANKLRTHNAKYPDIY